MCKMSFKSVDCYTIDDYRRRSVSGYCVYDVEEKTKWEQDQGHYLIDMFFSKLKILIGFYQVTHGLLQVFSYIDWPDSLQAVATYSGILQLNLLQIAPIHCLFSGLHVNAFGELFLMLTLNLSVIGASGFCYVIYRSVTLKNDDLEEEEKSSKISRTKQLFYKNLCFFLYVTYLSTFSKTASVLPFACRKLCRDDKETRKSCVKNTPKQITV